jgi:hypothetical protein
MVILYAAFVANRAMMHAWELINLTLLAILEVP